MEPAAEQGRVDKTERLLNLVSCLLAARTPVPFSDIRGQVVGYDDGADPEAMEKRFDRDKAELRALGVPIEYVAMDKHGNSGYGIRKDRYFLPEISLDVEEALVLAVLHRMAAEGGEALGPNLLSALQKVSADSPLGEGLRSSLAEQHAFGLRPGGRGAGEEHEALEALTAAVLGRRRVRFRYYAIGKDETRDRDVDPWGLGYHRGHWYLVGHDHLRGAVRNFRVDRIRGKVRPGKPGSYAVDAGFDVQGHVGRPPWEFEAKAPFRARIRFAPAIAWMVQENLRRGEAFREEAGGGGVLEIRARDRGSVLRFAMKHGRLAEILGPPALREEARALYREVLARHRGPPRPTTPEPRAGRKGAGRGRAS